MFKKLRDLVASPAAEQNVQHLTSMGFTEADARAALQQSNGNLEQAANSLLMRGATSTSATAHGIQRQQVEDDDLQRALQASLAPASNPVLQQKQRPPQRNHFQSAAASKAGKAALNRFNTGSSAGSSRSKSPVPSHPNVKVPKKLSEKSKEEQILRTADRLKSSPQALDTLYKTLKTLQANPSDPKFKRIDQTTGGYQKSLGNAPGSEDLLIAMNYRKSGPNLLVLDFVDQATLYLGISALEQTRLTPEYKNAKELINFEKEVLRMFHSADASTQEAIARSDHMSKLPTEPTMGGAWIFLSFEGTSQKLQRKFDGDDTLQDVLHWIAGSGTEILDKLKSGEWELVDIHRAPPAPLNIELYAPKTLQYIGCWPSGKLRVRPTVAVPSQTSNERMGSARGLGAARLAS